MPPQASHEERPNRKIRGLTLSEEIHEKLDKEPHGNQSLIAENLFRMYYDLPPRQMDEIKNSRFDQ